MCNAQIDGFNPVHNKLMMMEQLDSLEEYQEVAIIRLAEYQQKLARHYNREVKVREFDAGDLVL